jgi:POT family proton-dependent oligopeptide transporter
MSEMLVKNKRPFGFYVCCIAFMFERMAYYSAKYLVFFFVSATIITGGLGLTLVQAAIIQSNLVAFTYLAPIVGGYLSDNHIGARYCIPVGLLLMAAGYIVGGSATTVFNMNVMVALVSIGTGLFKGNNAAISGALFEDKAQLDSAFSVQYSFVNIGAFIGTLSVGVLIATTFAKGDVQGFRAAFVLCGIICVIDAVWFLFGMKYLGEVGKKPFKAGKHTEKKSAAVIKAEAKPLTRVEKRKVFAIVLISIFSVIFWVFWYLTYVAVYDYGAKFVNMNVGGFAVPLSWFDSLNSLTCIIMGPILGILWFKLSKTVRGDLSLFKKLGIGLSLLGMSFLMLVGAELSRGTGKASIIWIIAFGVLLSMGEMLFSPLGNSFVTKYSPNKMFSVLMGVWIFATFIAGKSYGYLYAFASKFPIIQAYVAIPVILFVFASLLFIFDKKLIKLLEDGEQAKNV